MTSAATTTPDAKGMSERLASAMHAAYQASVRNKGAAGGAAHAPEVRKSTPEERDAAVAKALAKAGVPKRYRALEADFGFDDVLSGGTGLYIQGAVGAGKTHLACAVAKAFASSRLADTQVLPMVKADIRFIASIDYLSRLKETYDASTGVAESSVVRSFAECDLLVLDDLGKDLPTEWAVNRIFQLLNARYGECLPTVITTQYTPEQLAKKFSRRADAVDAEAIVSRIAEMCAPVMLDSPDRRIGRQAVYRLAPSPDGGWGAVA